VFRRKKLYLSSGSGRNIQGKKQQNQVELKTITPTAIHESNQPEFRLLGLFFDQENGTNIFFTNYR
jgi:hypothetical protein